MQAIVDAVNCLPRRRSHASTLGMRSRIQMAAWAAIPFVLGVGVAMLVMNSIDAEAADWVVFAGACIGAPFAVFASLVLVDSEIRRKETRERDVVRSLLIDAKTSAMTIINWANNAKDDATLEQRKLLAVCALSLRAAHDVAEKLMTNSAALARVTLGIAEFRDEIVDAKSLADDREVEWWRRAVPVAHNFEKAAVIGLRMLEVGEFPMGRDPALQKPNNVA